MQDELLEIDATALRFDVAESENFLVELGGLEADSIETTAELVRTDPAAKKQVADKFRLHSENGETVPCDLMTALLVPYFLYLGAHVLEDLPRELDEARLRHPGVEMAMGRHLGVHKRLAKLVIDRIGESFQEKGWN